MFSEVAFNPVVSKASSRNTGELKILAIMAEFQTDVIHQTTGDGKFDLNNRIYPDTLKIDAPPHNREYFEDHLLFMKNYYNSVSGGQDVIVNFTVLDTVLTLPNKMWHYNFNNPDFDSLEKLKELHRDAWSQVIDNQNINFADYNTFVIFHAGTGQEFSTPSDETPFDIPSAFLNDHDLSEDFRLIAHDGTVIDNGIILPESEWQIFDDGWYMAGLHAASVIMFSHRLGLPNLYKSADDSLTGDAAKYMSGVGRFDCMDQGSGNFSGLIPSKPSAWCREYLGWADIKELKEPASDLIAKVDSVIYKLDLNDNEYLLLENRLSHTAKKDSMWSATLEDSVNFTTGYDRNGKKIHLFYDKDWNIKYEMEDGFRVITRVDNYDFAIPASGLFIWHIDKRKTTPDHIYNNSVNGDHEKRGVYLEEADGSFDIGREFGFLQFGYGKEFGWLYDAHFDSNYVWKKYANKALYSNNGKIIEYSDKSYPPSDTNDEIKTGIKLYKFSNPGEKMTFSYGRDNVVEGYPFQTEYPAKYTLGKDSIRILFSSENDSQRIYKGKSPLPDFQFSCSNSLKPVIKDDLLIFVSEDHINTIRIDLNTSYADQIVWDNTIRYLNSRLVVSDEHIYDQDGSQIFNTYSIPLDEVVLDIACGNSNIAILTDKGLAFGDNVISQKSEDLYTRLNLFQNESESYVMVSNDNSYQIYSFEGDKIYEESNINGTVVGLFQVVSDSKPEVLIIEDNQLLVENVYGILENSFPAPIGSTFTDFSDMYFVEKDEILHMIFVDNSGNINIIDNNGELQRQYTFNAGKRENSSYYLSQIGNDVVLNTIDEFGQINAFYVMDGNLIETKYSGDDLGFTRNPFVYSDTNLNQKGSGIVRSGNVYNWPNPIRENFTNFRFYLNNPANVKIEIYDMTGDKKDTLEEEVNITMNYYEIRWETKLPSGVYYAKVVFDDGNSKETYTVKLAIVR